ncbi:tRNA-binding protein [Myroides indicus]|uniref:tRNA-binding protein n=1 Tax=Myroides indicus TaxID=1323422 RepID=A0A4R7EQ08_9FLAO|nr:tRNA-binding protein [Myroides indicus]TDS54008.1 tRNA-binding protein [Myroides indicus]
MDNNANILSWNQFMQVEMHVGTIIQAEIFKEARNPAYKLIIDFGQKIGTRKTSAQITNLYTLEDLIGKQVIAVINFPPKQIANFMSECLVMGAVDGRDVTLMTVDKPVKNGLRIG